MSRKGVPQVPGSQTKADQRISSHEFNAKALNGASVEPVVCEYRGSARLVTDYRGLITAQLHGARVIR